jgi:hypothetical protein
MQGANCVHSAINHIAPQEVCHSQHSGWLQSHQAKQYWVQRVTFHHVVSSPVHHITCIVLVRQYNALVPQKQKKP